LICFFSFYLPKREEIVAPVEEQVVELLLELLLLLEEHPIGEEFLEYSPPIVCVPQIIVFEFVWLIGDRPIDFLKFAI